MMNQKKMLLLLSEGQTKIELAHTLIRSDKKADKDNLLMLREWFWQDADIVKQALQNDRHVDAARRQMLERLVNDYTVVITENDEKINQDNLFVKL